MEFSITHQIFISCSKYSVTKHVNLCTMYPFRCELFFRLLPQVYSFYINHFLTIHYIQQRPATYNSVHFIECEPGWDLIWFKCYKVYPALTKFMPAASACLTKGAVLASLINREHQKELACKSGTCVLNCLENSKACICLNNMAASLNKCK